MSALNARTPHMAPKRVPATSPRSLLLPAAAVLLVWLLGLAGALTPLDRAWFGWMQRAFAERAPLPKDTAIVLIDEQSLQALGAEPFTMRWPWPRGAFAAMFAALHRAGAASITVDLIFFEQSDAAEQDMLLGAVAAGLEHVTLGAMPAADGRPAQLPVVWPETFRKQHPGMFTGKPRWGFVQPPQDSDGVIRRYAPGGSLAEVALGRAQPGDAPTGETTLLRWRGGLETLRKRGVPLIPAAPFVAAGWPMLDAATEVAPDLDPAALARAIEAQPAPEGAVFEAVCGKRVFIGANAAATFDYVATPAGAPEPGVLVHWTALASLEAGDDLEPAGRVAETLALVLFAGAIGFLARGGAGLRRPAIASAGGTILAIAGSAAAFPGGIWFAPALPVAGVVAAFTAAAVESFRIERARKREIQGWFGAYVSPAIVRQLVENPGTLRLGGDRRDVSLFFSDLVGFTSLSEQLPPDQLVAIVNSCLEEQSESIFEQGGYIDKYIGDAVMGVFGSPEELNNHALAACRAALDSQRRLAALNEGFERDHGVRLGMRIGINSGEAIVGNVGSERKKNFTALGDTVNLAARLEGANKEFGTAILIGPLTAARASHAILCRPIARLRVKGKTQAVDVHEPLAEIDAADEPTRRFAAACKEGFEAWCVRDFARAARAYGEAVDLRPGDFPATRYCADARRLAASPPPADWQPILTLDSK
ncbi:MAG: CHASE2 domain-containing protein [Opitutaceae bacterium]